MKGESSELLTSSDLKDHKMALIHCPRQLPHFAWQKDELRDQAPLVFEQRSGLNVRCI
jgi:hypothetical protein